MSLPDLEFKEAEKDGLPVERDSASRDANPDNAAYNTVQKLEMDETRLKYSMRRMVTGFLTICAAIVMTTFTLHLVLPSWARWLTPEEIGNIKDIALTVFGGLAMSTGTLFFSKK